MTTNTQATEVINKKSLLTVRPMVQMGMLAAIATILMMFEIPLPFAPSFYKIDFSEIPVLIGSFALGPVAGVIIEALKVLLHVVFKGSTTMGIGDAANFLVGISFVLPASLIYRRHKTRKTAVIGMIVGTLFMTAAGCVMNAYVLLPLYAKMFHMPMDTLIAMGSAVNPAIHGLGGFVMLAVAPFNLLKGALVSIITFLIYKKISHLLKANTL